MKNIRTLNHPNIARFIGAEISSKEIYIITEYYPNGSLYKLIHEEKRKLNSKVEREEKLINTSSFLLTIMNGKKGNYWHRIRNSLWNVIPSFKEDHASRLEEVRKTPYLSLKCSNLVFQVQMYSLTYLFLHTLETLVLVMKWYLHSHTLLLEPLFGWHQKWWNPHPILFLQMSMDIQSSFMKWHRINFHFKDWIQLKWCSKLLEMSDLLFLITSTTDWNKS